MIYSTSLIILFDLWIRDMYVNPYASCISDASPVQSSVGQKIPSQNMFSFVHDYKVPPVSQVME